MKISDYLKYTTRTGVLLFLSLSLMACEEVFEVDIADTLADGIAFKGLISNASPPYFFQLTKPAPLSAEEFCYEGINDALIVIEDVTAGIKDTLCWVEPLWDQYGFYYSYYNYSAGRKDISRIPSTGYEKVNGVYATTKIYGIEGHTYTLDIHYKGVHHTAEETMVPKTLITDLKLKEVDLGEKGKKTAPCISFVNAPGVDNYYLLFVHMYSTNTFPVSSLNSLFRSSEESWGYSILSDEHLGETVTDLVVSDGEDVAGNPPGSNYPPIEGDSVFVCMQSISKACYDVYGQVIEQLRTDGGAYSPSPANVKGNISGGVWGCFRVSAYSEKGIY